VFINKSIRGREISGNHLQGFIGATKIIIPKDCNIKIKDFLHIEIPNMQDRISLTRTNLSIVNEKVGLFFINFIPF
jgi:hypothetical protein